MRLLLALLLSLAGALPIAHASGERIDGEIVVHGRRLAVERLDEPVAAREAAAAAARRWRSDGSPVIESRSGDWWIVSRHRGDRLETEQWRERPGGRSEGIRSSLPRERAVPAWSALAPASRLGLSPVAESDSVGAGRSIRTAVYLVPESAAQLHARWRGALQAEGFGAPTMPGPLSPAGARPDRSGSIHGGGFAGLHRSGAEEIVWTVAPHRSGAALVVHRGLIGTRASPQAGRPEPGPFLSTEVPR